MSPIASSSQDIGTTRPNAMACVEGQRATAGARPPLPGLLSTTAQAVP